METPSKPFTCKKNKNEITEQPTSSSEAQPLTCPLAQTSLPARTPHDYTIKQKAIRIAMALVLALLSFFPLADFASSPETYANTIETLDDKKANVTALAASTAAMSTAISLLPDDIGSSVATELANLSSDFTIVLAAILLEKYLLTIIGMASFKMLVPISCIIYAAATLNPRFRIQGNRFAAKIAALAIVLVAIVPLSAGISNTIDETFETSSQIAAVTESESTEPQSTEESEAGESSSFFERFKDFSSSAIAAASQTSESAIQFATSKLNHYLEAFSIMMITSCVIPILVLIAAFWLVGALFGLDTSAPITAIASRSWRKPMSKKREEIIGIISDAENTMAHPDE